MKKIVNGKYIELTPEEIAAIQAEQRQHEAEYWMGVDYAEAVNAKIRERYTVSQEFAILRQREEKPDEYTEYYTYCEECKTYVKSQKAKYTN